MSKILTENELVAGPQDVILFGRRMPERIPPLSGWFLRLFQIVWWASFAAALIGIVFLSVPEGHRDQQLALGVYSTGVDVLDQTDDGLEVSPFTEAARAAGVRTNDIVTAVDGQPLQGDLKTRAGQFGGHDGSVARLTLRHADGTRESVRIIRDSNYIKQAHAGSSLTFEFWSWAQFAINTGYGLFLMLVSLVLILKRAREPVAALLAFGWTFASIPFAAMGLPNVIEHISVAVLMVCVPLGISLFPDSRFVSRWNWFVLISILVMSTSRFLSRGNMFAGFPDFYQPAVFATFGLLGVAVVVRYRKLRSGTEQQQLKFFTLGLVVLSISMMIRVFTSLSIADLPIGGAYGWLVLANVCLVAFGFSIFGAGILISLLRYRLYDAERTISRSVALGALTLTLLAIFAGSEKVIELLGEEWFGEDLGALAGGLGAALAALMIVPLHKRLDHWAERRFQTDLTKLRETFPLLVADLRETTAPEGIAANALETIMPTVRTERGVLVTDTSPMVLRGLTDAEFSAWDADLKPLDASGLQTETDDPLLPTRLSLEAPGHGRIGWLLLGPRPDGSTIGKDEREALMAIADPLARALQVSAQREERENMQGVRIASLEEHVGRIKELDEKVESILQSLQAQRAEPLKS